MAIRFFIPAVAASLALAPVIISAQANDLPNADMENKKQETVMSDKFRQVTSDFYVSPQISVDDIKDAAAMGVTLIINNRPDGEMIGQPTSAQIEAAAKAAGLAYAHIPVDQTGITPNHTAAFEDVVNEADDGKTLAFCRSGTRSILVRSYAAARFGKPVDQIISEAAEAGYDISGHEPAMTLLHDASKAPRTDPPV